MAPDSFTLTVLSKARDVGHCHHDDVDVQGEGVRRVVDDKTRHTRPEHKGWCNQCQSFFVIVKAGMGYGGVGSSRVEVSRVFCSVAQAEQKQAT